MNATPIRPATSTRARHPAESSCKAVRQKLNKLRRDYGFIPADKLYSMLDMETVATVLDEIAELKPRDRAHADPAHYFTEEDHERVYQRYRVVLAILIDLSREEFLAAFYPWVTTDDSYLPFTKAALEEADPELNSDTDFLKRQYDFLPPTLTRNAFTWSEDYVLPFVEVERIGSGHYGTVDKVKVYELYDQLDLPPFLGKEGEKVNTAFSFMNWRLIIS